MTFPLAHPFKILFLLQTILLVACVSHQQYRSSYDPCISTDPENDCKTSSIQEYQNPSATDQSYMLGFIEFDDQGQLWDRQQMRKVRDHLSFASAKQDLLMVVYVHGWKHNAEVGDTNVRSFRDTLRRLSAMETAINPQPRKIIGLYLGWRGASVSLPLAKEFTFWDRKNTAHKVGYGGVTEVLSRLELLQKTKQDIARRDGLESTTRLVVVGHSFGGAVVYSALSEILENGFVQTRGPDGITSDTIGFGDLVVLINPAFEAVRFATLSDMANARGTYFPHQLPALAVLTSEADYATKLAFPAGRWLSTLFETEREVVRDNPVTKQQETIDQGEANVTTVGHFDHYRTHYLRASDGVEPDQNEIFDLDAEVASFLTVSQLWENDRPGSVIAFNGSSLKRTPNSAGRNPVLNIKVDKALIPDHSDIYDPRIESFIRQLIMISSQSEKLEIRQQRRHHIEAEAD